MDFDLALGAGEVKVAGVFQEKEVLNVMDEVGSLWQISIEGSRVRVVNSTPLEVHVLYSTVLVGVVCTECWCDRRCAVRDLSSMFCVDCCVN